MGADLQRSDDHRGGRRSTGASQRHPGDESTELSHGERSEEANGNSQFGDLILGNRELALQSGFALLPGQLSFPRINCKVHSRHLDEKHYYLETGILVVVKWEN